MTYASIRWWFCVAAAVIAAAVADPLVEAVSNSGCFGHGLFTDHSNLDVIPALVAGAVLGLCYLVLRVRRELVRASGYALRSHFGRLLPLIVTLQFAVLYAMETVEQFAVAGHALGGTIWLGGPILFSVAVHAIVGVALAYGLAALARAFARTTVRAIALLCALATRALHVDAPLALRRRGTILRPCGAPILCRIGNRAPPFSLV